MSESHGTLFDTILDRSTAKAYEALSGNLLSETGEPLSANARSVLRIVADRHGAGRAIASADLERLINCSDRIVRSAISELRNDFGLPIGSSRNTDQGGYYLISTKDELFDTVRPFLNQATSELRLVRRMLQPHELRELAGQLNLNLNDLPAEPAKEIHHAA